MTTTPLAPADREQLIAAGHHPLAFCEWCNQPVPGVLADCDNRECRTKAIALDMYFVRREDV